jgi:hypothetical protein
MATLPSHKVHGHALHCIACTPLFYWIWIPVPCWLTAENMAFFIRSGPRWRCQFKRTESGCYSVYTSEYGVLVNSIYIILKVWHAWQNSAAHRTCGAAAGDRTA